MDRDKRSCSFVRIVGELADRDLCAALQARARTWDLELALPADAAVAGGQAGPMEEQLLRRMPRLARAAASLASDPVARKLRTFRDKLIAHLEMQSSHAIVAPFELSSLAPTHSDLFGFIDGHRHLVFTLGLAVKGNSFDLEAYQTVFRRNGTDLWRILAGLSPMPSEE